jgi:hypothetical protein
MRPTVSASGHSGPRAGKEPLPRFEEILATIAPRFVRDEAVGLLLLDAVSFGGLERTYGAAAYQNVLSKLGALIRETSEGRLRAEDYVARGPTGQAEILVFLIRPPSEASTLPD